VEHERARFATNGAYLNYHWIEPTEGHTNYSCARGSIWLWYRPLFSGTNHSGSGPGSSARLIDVGSFDSGDWWAIHLNPAGDRIFFSGANTNGSGVYAESPIACVSNQWIFIAVNYSSTNSAILLNGTNAANGNGVLYPPSPSGTSNGLFIGSDALGGSVAKGDIELLRLYGGHSMPEEMIGGYYTNTLARIQEWEGGGGGALVSGGGDGSLQLEGGQGNEGSTSSLIGQSLSVGITYDPPSGFLLDVLNMTPGVLYGVGAKDTIELDPFNTWSLVSLFTAQAPNEQLSGTASVPTRFYIAINLDEYAGPSVSIVSPAAGSTVAGDMPIQIIVTDVLPLLSVEVYVGAVQVGVIQPGENGMMNLPTYWFPNGEQEIWVRIVNEGVPVDTDGDAVADEEAPFQVWRSVAVNFANDVYMQSYSPLYSAAGSISLEYFANAPQNYTFEVFRLNGDLLHTDNGQSINGSMVPQWDFSDLAGQPVSDAGYVFSLTATPQTGGGGTSAAAGGTIRTTNFVDRGVTVGKYVISYGEYANSELNDWHSGMNDAVSSLANTAAVLDEDIIGPNREAHGIIRADFPSEPYKIRQAMQTADLTALTNALKDPIVGSWLFQGHSGFFGIIRGVDGYLTANLTAQEIATLLGNSFSSPLGTNLFYTRRLFSTFITGCGAIGGFLPIATGTPPGVKQEGNPWVKKSAFVGFNGASFPGEIKSQWITRIHGRWIDGNDYDTLLKTAVDLANLDYPTVQSWGPAVIGYRFWEYNGADSR
jgi:hypothetical protein